MVLDTSEQLVEQWVAAWVHVRDLATTRRDGWPLVHVASPSRETEIVCVDPGVTHWHELTRHVAEDPRAMLTVMAHDVGPYLTARRRDGVRVDRDDETLMSATLDAAPVARYLGDCPIVEVPGAVHPLAIEYAPAESVPDAVRGVVPRTAGQVLCFLPGRREIESAAATLASAHSVTPSSANDDACTPASRAAGSSGASGVQSPASSRSAAARCTVTMRRTVAASSRSASTRP